MRFHFHQILSGIFILFLIISLCGCQEEPAPMGTYTGTLDGYTYYHSDARDLHWEEDILYLAETFLQYEPFLAEKSFTCIGREGKEHTSAESHQDPELRSIFLQEINSLIPRISELDDIQILYETQKIAAGLSDAHSEIYLPQSRFPFAIVPFYEEGEMVYRACSVPATSEKVLFGKLLAINNVPVGEIVEQLVPYVSCENEYWALNTISNPYNSMLLFVDGLQVIGVIDQGVTEAEFLFEAENGEKVTITAEAFNEDGTNLPEMMRRTFYHTKTLAYQHNDLSYWMQELPENQALYVRFNEVAERKDLSYSQFFYNIMHTIHESNTVQKLIIDLRDNAGGRSFDNLEAFLQSLNDSGISVYVLVDNATFSAAVRIAANIMQIVEHAVLVGTPTGEPPIIYGNSVVYTMPYSGYEFSVSVRYYDIWPGYEGDALMPDVIIYQTIDDLKNGIDTVLTQVLNGLDEQY